METLTNDAAILLALGQGPSSGVGLMKRLRQAPFGLGSLGPGTLYPLLRQLEQTGLTRGWLERGRSRVGRPCRYQELTASGVAALGRLRRQLRSLSGGPTLPAASHQIEREMRANLRRCFEVSGFALKLHKSGKH